MLQFVVLLILFLWSLTTGAKAEQKEIVIEEKIRAAEIEMAEVSGPNAKRSPRLITMTKHHSLTHCESTENPMRSPRPAKVRTSTTDSLSSSPLEFDDLEAAVSVEDSHGKRGPSSISNLKYFNSSLQTIGTPKVRGRKEKVAMCDAAGAKAKPLAPEEKEAAAVEVEMPELKAEVLEETAEAYDVEAPVEEVQEPWVDPVLQPYLEEYPEEYANAGDAYAEETQPPPEVYAEEYQEDYQGEWYDADYTADPAAAEAEEPPLDPPPQEVEAEQAYEEEYERGEEEDAFYPHTSFGNGSDGSSASWLLPVAEDEPHVPPSAAEGNEPNGTAEEEEDELTSVRARLRRVLDESQNQRQTSTDERNNAADNAWERLMQDSRGNWVEILDDDGILLGEEFKGRLIYYNKITTEVRFTKPPGWVRMQAEATDSYVMKQRASVMTRPSNSGPARGNLMALRGVGGRSFDFAGSFNGSDNGSSGPGSFNESAGGGSRRSMQRGTSGRPNSPLGHSRLGSNRHSSRVSMQWGSQGDLGGGAVDEGGEGGEGGEEEGGTVLSEDIEEFNKRRSSQFF
jgi:hypothetical protein